MDANELLRKVRQIEIKTRGLSQNIFAGEYHTAFKGRGVMFSEAEDQDAKRTSRVESYGVTMGEILSGDMKASSEGCCLT